MAKESGLGDNLYVNGTDVSGDINSCDEIGGGNEPLNMTSLPKSAMERQGGLRDGRLKFKSYFNSTALGTHTVLSPLPTSDVIMSYWHGATLGGPAASIIGKQVNYDGKRGDDGSLLFDVEEPGNGFGLEWGISLTAGKRSEVAATNGSSVDFGTTAAPSAYGLQCYLHVFSWAGTLTSINVQESSDNGAGDAFANVAGAAFAVSSATPAAQRVATANPLNVERYLRVITSGTFSQITFALMVVRNVLPANS